MIVTKGHAELIIQLIEKWNDGLELERVGDGLTDDALEYLYHLELAGLVYEDDDRFILSQAGHLIGETLLEFVRSGRSADEWDADFRWIGSEVISMIEVARASQGEVDDQPAITAELERRGFMKDGRLLPAAESVLEAYNIAGPDIFLPPALCEKIKQSPPGPGKKGLLPFSQDEIFQLEAMRLLTFSLPVGGNYSFTGAGQQIRAGLLKGGAPVAPITAETLFYLLDDDLSDDVGEELMEIGAINADKELLPAGVHFKKAAELLFVSPVTINPSIDVDSDDLVVMEVIEDLWKEHGSNPEIYPSYKAIKKEVEKRREVANTWKISYSLHLLESFRLVDSERLGEGELVYRLTEWGEKVLQDRKEHALKPVFATGVMAITTPRMENLSPDDVWVDVAADQGLVGKGYPTKSGRLFAGLASGIERLPLISAFEGRVLKALPLWRGMFERRLLSFFPEEEKGLVLAAVRKLLAQGLIDALPGGLYSVTEAGRKFKEGVAGVRDERKFHVTPHILGLLLAMTDVIEREGKLDWKKVERATKFDPDVFNEVHTQASYSHFIRGEKLTTAGELLVEGVEILKEHQTLWEEIEL